MMVLLLKSAPPDPHSSPTSLADTPVVSSPRLVFCASHPCLLSVLSLQNIAHQPDVLHRSNEHVMIENAGSMVSVGGSGSCARLYSHR